MSLPNRALLALTLSSTGAFAQPPAAPDKFALLVGVNEYDHADLKKRKGAEADQPHRLASRNDLVGRTRARCCGDRAVCCHGDQVSCSH